MAERYDRPMANPSQDPPLLDVAVTTDDGRSRVSVAGELDAASAGELEAALSTVADGGTVELDLGGVSFIDSSGLPRCSSLSRLPTTPAARSSSR